MKKIGYLGAGTWGFALTSILALNGHAVTVWTRDPAFADHLEKTRVHPKLPGITAAPNIRFTSDLKECVRGAEVLVESVTTAGIRPVFRDLLALRSVDVPVIITSKGIEQGTGLLIPEILASMMELNMLAASSGLATQKR